MDAALGGQRAGYYLELTQLIVAAAAEKIMCWVNVSSWSSVTPRSWTVVKKVKCGYFKANEARSVLKSCWGVPSQMSWVLAGFSRRRLDDIQTCRASRVWLIDPTAASAWVAMQWIYADGLQVIGIGGLTQDVPSCEKGPQIGSVNYI